MADSCCGEAHAVRAPLLYAEDAQWRDGGKGDGVIEEETFELRRATNGSPKNQRNAVATEVTTAGGSK